jgi:hypothetical protein
MFRFTLVLLGVILQRCHCFSLLTPRFGSADTQVQPFCEELGLDVNAFVDPSGNCTNWEIFLGHRQQCALIYYHMMWLQRFFGYFEFGRNLWYRVCRTWGRDVHLCCIVCLLGVWAKFGGLVRQHMSVPALSMANERQEGWSGPGRRVSATPPVLLGRWPFSE